jgi:ribonucleoside-diphosphate reductase alpha chain
MPSERDSITRKLSLDTITLYATVGLREDGTPGELFLTANSVGTLERGLLHAVALLVSLALQHQVPLTKIVEKMKGIAFEPRGFTGDPAIPSATSIVDYVAQWLEKRFLGA